MRESFDIEREGAAAGTNPFFGEWQQRFDMEPISYANGSKARETFKNAIRAKLSNKYVFVGEVSLKVVLYLNEQKMLESPSYGDLDNYAKLLIDSIKGKGGVLIDDCQVQHIDISWIDVPQATHFDINVKASPDDFLPLPLRLYEMPDDLFYPLSDQIWTADGLKPVTQEQFLNLARSLAEITQKKRNLRHDLRQCGSTQDQAFQSTKWALPTVMGFHRTRIEQAGFDMVLKKSWAGGV